MLTNVINNTFITLRISCGAYVAAVEQNPVMGVCEKLRGNAGQQGFFNCFRCITLCESNFRRNSEQVGIYRHCRLAEDYI